jgi:predicted RNA-binding Zn-ribbon protein involved in translation (DUF1610 family)
MVEAEASFTAKCTKCDTAAIVADPNNELAAVTCPNCGAALGSWAEIKEGMRQAVLGVRHPGHLLENGDEGWKIAKE